MATEKLLSVQEAAAWIGMSESDIRMATFGGHLPFVRRSGHNWIEAAQLQAYRRVQEDQTKGE